MRSSSVLAAAKSEMQSPDVAHDTPLRANRMSDAFPNVRADKHSIPVRQGRRSLMARLYERRNYRDFLIAFGLPDEVFVFDAAGTPSCLSVNRDVSLQQG